MASPFASLEVDEELRPVAQLFDFDLEARLSSVVVLESKISPEALSAKSLGTARFGNAIVIGAEGLLLTIGYLVTEADEVTLTTNAGVSVAAHVLGISVNAVNAPLHRARQALRELLEPCLVEAAS